MQSVEGRGTQFIVYLPVSARAEQVAPAPVLARTASSAALKVLLAEDDPSVAAITEMMLTNLGHEVTRAENAEQALDVLRSGRQLDLLLSDVIMPGGLNGVELARLAVGLRPGLKILLSSGYAGESMDKALAEGVWPFLRKPYLEGELAAHLQMVSAEAADETV